MTKEEWIERAARKLCELDGFIPDTWLGGTRELPFHQRWEIYKPKAAALYPLVQEAVGGWRDISSAPRDGTWFLAFWPVSAIESQARVTMWMDDPHEPYFVDVDDWCDWTQPTHWMPLPPAPKENNDAAG